MEPKNPNPPKTAIPPQLNTISRAEAIKRTRNWRDQLMDLFSPPTTTGPTLAQVPKCLHISLTDISQIVYDYGKAGYTISGIRIYFTLENENAKKNFHITGIVVPTIQPPTAITGVHEDLIVPVSIINGSTGQDSTGVSVYDFTRPCPTYCSGTTDELTGAS